MAHLSPCLLYAGRYEPLRLIWVADLISLVEAWVDVLDWERVRRQYLRSVECAAAAASPVALVGRGAGTTETPC